MVDAQQSEIQVGQVAPDFRLPTQAAQFITLSEFRGRPVVIATFALAFTSGWTNQLVGFRERIEEFDRLGAQVLGLSADAWPSLKRFHEELSLPYPLVSDFRDRIFVANYGIYNEKYGTPQRRTYVIDGQGVIRHVVVNDKDMQAHSIDALDALRRL